MPTAFMYDSLILVVWTKAYVFLLDNSVYGEFGEQVNTEFAADR